MRAVRQRIFVGCEGKGERSLAIVLQRFANECGLAVHLDPFDAHGGSPIKIVSESLKEAKLREKRRGPFDGGLFVMIDQDRIDSDDCEAELILTCQRSKLQLVPQLKRLECVLARLISGDLSMSSDKTDRFLTRHWPEYDRSFDAATLAAKVDVDVLKKSHDLTPGWAALLDAIGFRRAVPARRRRPTK